MITTRVCWKRDDGFVLHHEIMIILPESLVERFVHTLTKFYQPILRDLLLESTFDWLHDGFDKMDDGLLVGWMTQFVELSVQVSYNHGFGF